MLAMGAFGAASQLKRKENPIKLPRNN
ncbi:hypothetical protein [Coleofasciculus sp. LEGE 07081]